MTHAPELTHTCSCNDPFDPRTQLSLTPSVDQLNPQDKLELAIEQYQKSLMEHRNADTLTRLNNTEKTLKDKVVKVRAAPPRDDLACALPCSA
jgi:hypothetical protein